MGFLVWCREKLKKSNGGPIADEYLGSEMLCPMLSTLSEATRGGQKVTLSLAKAEWEKHKQIFLQRHNAPPKQQPKQQARARRPMPKPAPKQGAPTCRSAMRKAMP